MKIVKIAAAFFFSIVAGAAGAAAYPGDSTGFSGYIGASPLAPAAGGVGGVATAACSWQNVTAARQLGSVYANSTGTFLYVAVVGSVYNGTYAGYVNGYPVPVSQTTSSTQPLEFVVAPGDRYTVVSTGFGMYTTVPHGAFVDWAECR